MFQSNLRKLCVELFLSSFICDVAFIEVNTCTVKFMFMPILAKFFWHSIEQQEYYVNFILID